MSSECTRSAVRGVSARRLGQPVRPRAVRLARRSERVLGALGAIVSGSGPTVALLARNDDPTDDEIRHAIEGNICRCTGYHNIVKSIQFCQSGKTPTAV